MCGRIPFPLLFLLTLEKNYISESYVVANEVQPRGKIAKRTRYAYGAECGYIFGK